MGVPFTIMCGVRPTIGSSADVHEIERLFLQAKQILQANLSGQPWLLPVKSRDDLLIEQFAANLSGAQIRTVGPEIIFGALFDRIGFSAIQDALLRHLWIG